MRRTASMVCATSPLPAGRIARVAEKIDPSEARKVVNAAGLYVTPGLIDIHVHLYHRTNPPPGAMDESVNPDAFSFRSGVTTMVDAGSSGWKDFADFRDHIIKQRAHPRPGIPEHRRRRGWTPGRETIPRRWMPKAPPGSRRRIRI